MNEQVVHGLSVPLGAAGYHIPRTLSTVLSSASGEPEPIRLPSNVTTHSTATPTSSRGLQFYRNRLGAQPRRSKNKNNNRDEPPRIVFQISRPQQQGLQQGDQQQEGQQNDVPAGTDPSPHQPDMPAVPTSVAVHEPSRPIRLIGDDGHVTETLNAEAD